MTAGPNEAIWVHWKGRRSGPFTESDIKSLLEKRELSVLHRLEVNGELRSVKDYLAKQTEVKNERMREEQALIHDYAAEGPVDDGSGDGFDEVVAPAHASNIAAGSEGSTVKSKLSDLAFKPLTDFWHFEWVADVRSWLLLLATIPPLFLLFLHGFISGQSMFLAFGIYFASLWLVIFAFILKPDIAILTKGVAIFTFNTVVWMNMYSDLTASIPFIGPIREYIGSLEYSEKPLVTRYLVMSYAVALPEEIFKLIPVTIALFLMNKSKRPQVGLFFGISSGLSFGIIEGVDYQLNYNTELLFETGDLVGYHALNLMRLTSLPLIHALWTGIAGYYLGLAARNTRHFSALVFMAILIPSCLHAAHNTFSMPGIFGLVGIFPTFLTVIALFTYLREGERFINKT